MEHAKGIEDREIEQRMANQRGEDAAWARRWAELCASIKACRRWRWTASPSSIGCPLASKTGSSRASVPQYSCIRVSRSSHGSFDGHTQATLKGVSPHPTALRPCPSSTRTQAQRGGVSTIDHLRAKFQRHPGLDRQKVEGRAADADISGAGHARKG